MNASNYVVAAYAVFALALGWDYLAPRLRLRRALRAIASRAQRDAARKASA
jgi:heme exporter protein D